jgi:hypothetical protein
MKKSEIPKRANTTDKTISTGIKYWICCIKEPCLNALNETEDAHLRNGLLLIPYLINIFFMFYYDKQ